MEEMNFASVVERNTRRTQNALIVTDRAGSNPVAGIHPCYLLNISTQEIFR